MKIKKGFFHICLELKQPHRQIHIDNGLNFRISSFLNISRNFDAIEMLGDDQKLIEMLLKKDPNVFVGDRVFSDFVVTSFTRIS